MPAIWHQLDKSLKLFPNSHDLLKQETVFRSGTKIKWTFFFPRKKNFGLIRISTRSCFEPRKRIGKNQKKLKHFIATSKITAFFLIYVDLTFNRKVKQISEIKLFIVLLKFYRKRKQLCFRITLNEDFVQLLVWPKPWKKSVIYTANCLWLV